MGGAAGMGGPVGMDMSQFVRGQSISENNNMNSYHQHGQYGIQPKQFDTVVPHQFNDNYFSDFGINLTNMNPLGGQYPSNVLSPYAGTQSSPDSLPRHASSPSVHQMMAGGLVQSSNEIVTNPPLPPYPPLSSQPPISNPAPIHCPSTKSKPTNTYLHPSQAGMVSPQAAAHRTQRVT